MAEILIGNGTVVTLGEVNRVLPGGAVLVRDGVVAEIADSARAAVVAAGASQAGASRSAHPDSGGVPPVGPASTREYVDAEGMIIMPGLLCAHTHFYGAFARGMSIPGEPPKNFLEILERLWWRLDKLLTLEDIRASAETFLVDAIRSGTTCVIDHHASPNAVDGSLDVIADAVERAGIRACLAYEVSDRDGPAVMRAGMRENERFIRAHLPSFPEKEGGNMDTKVASVSPPGSIAPPGRHTSLTTVSPFPLREGGRGVRLAGSFGLHASFTLSTGTLEACAAVGEALGVGFHIHVAEDRVDEDDSLAQYGVRTVERLAQARILGPRTIAAHCVHVDSDEIRRLAATHASAVHNARSNMNNAVGVAPVVELDAAGVPVGLGNDGFSMNMFQEIKTAYLMPKLAQRDPRVMGADTLVELAFTRNAQIAQAVFAPFTPDMPQLGTLAPGAAADLILLDYAPPTPLTAENFPWHLVFGMDGTHVHSMMVAGRWLMRNRQVLTLDEERIAAESRRLAEALWQRME
jgi:cytosine/adenosine deaminase-related metal-dependent hydrolase